MKVHRLAIALCIAASPAILFLAQRPPLYERTGFSRAYLDRNGRLLRLTLAPDGRYRLFQPLESISPQLVEATLLQEDRHFRLHPGFNPVSLARGALLTLGGKRSGGSTLTMQLARLIFKLNTRSIPGKLLQIARAVQIELHYTKDEILEAYLNLAPYGRNVEGVEAASLIWFGHGAGQLTLPEALVLVQLPKNPRWGAAIEARLWEGRQRLFEKWAKEHPEDEAARPEVLLPVELRPMSALPFLAPHAVDEVASRLQTPLDPAQAGEVRLSIDLAVQGQVERLVKAHVKRLESRGVTNGAAVVLDARTMEVLALVGSKDFFDRENNGQVNGAHAPRSPGSALKPFIYALALDSGLIHPRTLLTDLPQSFAGFNPENFDRDFVGPISATMALVNSRNVPAVSLAARLPPTALRDLLAAAGVGRLQPAEHYGLAIVLGGVEVSLEEMVSLYAMLARRGVWSPLGLLRGEALKEKRLLSPEAATLTVFMLRENPRPGRGYSQESTGRGPEVAWKTGTSAGFRDAWAIGISGPFVVGVFMGNFDGKPSRALVGREAAGPLMFDIFDTLRAITPDWPEVVPASPPPELNLKEVEVCAVSGLLPNPYCPHRVRTLFIPGKSPIEQCRLHREVLVEDETGLAACPGSIGAVRTHKAVFEFWPSDALELFRRAGVIRPTPPPLADRCREVPPEGMPPRITSPRPGSIYNMRLGMHEVNRLPLKAVCEAGVRTVHWFVDARYLGEADTTASLTWPLEVGRHTVRVVDDHGRAAARSFVVRAEVGR